MSDNCFITALCKSVTQCEIVIMSTCLVWFYPHLLRKSALVKVHSSLLREIGLESLLRPFFTLFSLGLTPYHAAGEKNKSRQFLKVIVSSYM